MDSMPVLEYKSLQKILQNVKFNSKRQSFKRKNTLFEFKKDNQRILKRPGNNEMLTDL